jgi:hypothetical protein
MNLQMMRTRLQHINPITLVAVFLMGALSLVSAGCGIKAPPVAPNAKPPVIATFTHTLVKGTLSLSWRLAAGSAPLKSCTFYRVRVSLADKPCEGCPLVFERILTVPADGRTSGVETVSVDPGYRYGFKMTATDANGLEGPDSKTISFSY